MNKYDRYAPILNDQYAPKSNDYYAPICMNANKNLIIHSKSDPTTKLQSNITVRFRFKVTEVMLNGWIFDINKMLIVT
jgi:hypothetical protein